MKHYLTSLLVVLAGSFLACTTPGKPPGPVEQETTPETRRESEATDPGKELEQIRANLEKVKDQLFDMGEYNCCIQPSCDWCALHEGSCTCFSNLVGGGAVCPGCGLGWHNGQGIVEGIDAGSVKWDIAHEHEHVSGHPH